MIVDINKLYIKHALDLLEWCLHNDIDKMNAIRILDEFVIPPAECSNDWTLDIPDKYMTWFILKWA